jgi:uncharacterized protein
MKQQLKSLLIFLLPLIITLGLGITPAYATGVYDFPSNPSETWVFDQAEVISVSNEGKLSDILEDLAENTGKEVRMVAIRRLDYGETIDSFADQLFRKWFPTSEAQADQTVLIIDSLTNNIAIRTGENVKAIMSDQVADSVAQETTAYPLRQGSKYNQAFLESSDRLVAILSGKADPGPPTLQSFNTESTFAKAEETDDRNATIWVIGLLIVATVIPMVTYYLYVR